MAGGAPTSERTRRAYVANMRQDLLSPVAALAGYADLLRDQSQTPPLQDFQEDVERIGAAVSDLTALIDRVLPAGGETELPAPDKVDDFESRLRHDLRNPLNAVKGYTELLLEEIGEETGATQPDLEKLLIETDALLASSIGSSTFQTLPPKRRWTLEMRTRPIRLPPSLSDRSKWSTSISRKVRKPAASLWSTTMPAIAISSIVGSASKVIRSPRPRVAREPWRSFAVRRLMPYSSI